MAVTIKEIQEKEFSQVANGGYSMEEVDDFLDAVVETVAAAMKDKAALQAKVAQLETALNTAEAEKAELEKKIPDYNEAGYFKNLEATIRESLISAQRIADAATAEAREQADKTIGDANTQAARTIEDAKALAEQTVADATATAAKTVGEAEAAAKAATEEAETKVAALKEEEAKLTEAVEGYRKSFREMVAAQMSALNVQI